MTSRPRETLPPPPLWLRRRRRALVNGDVGAAQDELIRRLQNRLPGLIAARNAAKGWAGAKAIPDIANPAKDIVPAPSVLTNAYIGKIVVDFDVETTQPVGGAFLNTATVTISSIDQRIQNAQMVRANWRFAETIRLCLYPFLTGCYNPDSFYYWRQLDPLGYGLLKSDWAKEFAGTSCRFRLIQAPGGGQ